MRPWQLELVAPQGQAIRARSALRPQGAKLLRARARLPIYHGLLSAAFLLCAHSSSNWLPHKGQAIRARSALRPQGAKLLRARARLPIYHGLLSAAFLLCTHSRSNWLPRRGKLFGHAVPCVRRAQNSLGRAKFTKILCSKQLLRSIQDFSARRANALLGRNNKDAVLYRDPSSRCAPQDDRGRGEFCRFAPAHRQNGASAK